MDPITIGLLLGGTALSGAGGFFGKSEAAKQAEREAAARNAALAKNIGILDQFGAQNRTTFDNNMANYTPEAQQKLLADSQTHRSDANVSNISQPNPDAVPLASGGQATGGNNASKSDLAKRMLAVYDGATARAKALGKLGGYSDAWTTNQLNNAQTGRDISVVNNYAEGRKALVGPESDLAGAAAYKPPSIWPALLSGAGSIMAGAGGKGLTGGLFGAAPVPNVPFYAPDDL
jgi:hypothetical protein